MITLARASALLATGLAAAAVVAVLAAPERDGGALVRLSVAPTAGQQASQPAGQGPAGQGPASRAPGLRDRGAGPAASGGDSAAGGASLSPSGYSPGAGAGQADGTATGGGSVTGGGAGGDGRNFRINVGHANVGPVRPRTRGGRGHVLWYRP